MPLNANRMIKLAADHVDWFSEILKPLLRSWMEHGYKHGFEDGSQAPTPYPYSDVFLIIEEKTGVPFGVCTAKKIAESVVASYSLGLFKVQQWPLNQIGKR